MPWIRTARRGRWLYTWIGAAVALALAASAVRAQSTAEQRPADGASDRTSPSRDEFPVSLERIRQALERAPQSRLVLPGRPTFSIEIEGRTPRIEDFIDMEELSRGPSASVALPHREFLDMVTPPEARQFAAFSGTELAVVAAQSLVTGVASASLPSLIRDAWRRRQEEKAREEVQELLAELARRAAQPQPPPP